MRKKISIIDAVNVGETSKTQKNVQTQPTGVLRTEYYAANFISKAQIEKTNKLNDTRSKIHILQIMTDKDDLAKSNL